MILCGGCAVRGMRSVIGALTLIRVVFPVVFFLHHCVKSNRSLGVLTSHDGQMADEKFTFKIPYLLSYCVKTSGKVRIPN